MDSYIELLYPCVSSQLWQFQTSFPPQLNRQKFWFIISPDRIIINPTFTAFHSNFMGCRDYDSFCHKFSPQILLFFSTVVSLQTFLFIPPFALLFALSLSVSSLTARVWNKPQECGLPQSLCVRVFMELVYECVPCMRVSAIHICEEQKWAKVPVSS